MGFTGSSDVSIEIDIFIISVDYSVLIQYAQNIQTHSKPGSILVVFRKPPKKNEKVLRDFKTSGQTESCENVSFTKSDWELLMSEITAFAGGTDDVDPMPLRNGFATAALVFVSSLVMLRYVVTHAFNLLGICKKHFVQVWWKMP